MRAAEAPVLLAPEAARLIALAIMAFWAGYAGASGYGAAAAESSAGVSPEALPCEDAVFVDAEGRKHSCGQYKSYGYCEGTHANYPWMMGNCANTCRGCVVPLRTPELLPAPSGGSKFRTRPCNSEGLFRDLSPVMAKVQLAEIKPEGTWPRIACTIYSYHKFRQRLIDAFATWGQDCDSFLAFSDHAFYDEELGLEAVEVHPDTYEEQSESHWNSINVVLRRHEAGTLDFDFLTFGDDDTFWILPNLRHYLRTDPAVAEARRAGRGVYLGHRLVLPHNHSNVFVHGGGIVMDVEAVEVVARCDTPFAQFAADPMFADCLAKASVLPLPTEDEFGAQRFNLFDDLTSARINYDNFTFGSGARYPEWLVAYHEPFRPLPGGLAGVSSQSVQFHYSTGQRRLEMHDQLYHRHVCGGSAPREGEL